MGEVRAMIVIERVTLADVVASVVIGVTVLLCSTVEAGYIVQAVWLVGCAICRTLGARDDA